MSRIFLMLLALLPFSAVAAEGVLYLSPARGSYSIGETFEVRVLADSDGTPVTAAEAELTFNPDALAVESISTDGSILTSFSTPPAFSNEEGSITFAGWTGQHFSGNEGLLITITFKALRNITSNAHLVAGAILAADGYGSNIISSMKSGLYAIEPERIVATATPEDLRDEERIDETLSLSSELRITDYEATLSEGDHIVVRGFAPPNTRIRVDVSGPGEEDSQIQSAADGSFTFASEHAVEEGVYRVSMRVEGLDGLPAGEGDHAIITVRSPGFAASMSSAAGLAETMLPIIITLVLGGIFVGYFTHQRRTRGA